MPAQKTLFMLIEPKGSGKAHIRTLVNRYTGISFLRLEPIWLSLEPSEDGWKKAETAIDALFQPHDKVMVESLGIGEGFTKSMHHLRKNTPSDRFASMPIWRPVSRAKKPEAMLSILLFRTIKSPQFQH